MDLPFTEVGPFCIKTTLSSPPQVALQSWLSAVVTSFADHLRPRIIRWAEIICAWRWNKYHIVVYSVVSRFFDNSVFYFVIPSFWKLSTTHAVAYWSHWNEWGVFFSSGNVKTCHRHDLVYHSTDANYMYDKYDNIIYYISFWKRLWNFIHKKNINNS